MADKKKMKVMYVCDNCGEEYIQWQGHCENCGQWNTIKEFKISGSGYGGGSVTASGAWQSGQSGWAGEVMSKPVLIEDVKIGVQNRLVSGVGEFDRVLGGGLVAGSVILLGGDPGIGKSTLLLQIADILSQKSEKKVIYFSAEESLTQIKVRAERLGILKSKLMFLAGSDLNMLEQSLGEDIGLLIVDSIQTVYDSNFPSTPGSLVQVRESALRLQRTAKRQNITIFLVGHITKEGTVAGPRTLEHLVDAVLYLEGDDKQDLRILRGAKNRFGSVNEVGLFAMMDSGMKPVENPNDYLLANRITAPGTVLTSVLEGTRPLLVEVQALTTGSVYGFPKRTASGFDLNRLNLLIAVLQKRAGIDLSNQDVFVNIVGGLKVKDPAVDLAVCLALASAFKNQAMPMELCVFGEVGLTGEVRPGFRHSAREKEVKKLGYLTVGDENNLRNVIKKYIK